MPISREELKSMSEEAGKGLDKRVAALEKEIDVLLELTRPEPGEQVPFDIPMVESDKVIEKIIADYAAVGVNVTRYQGVPQDACNKLIIEYK